MIFKKPQLYLMFGLGALIVVFALVAAFRGGSNTNQVPTFPLPTLSPSSVPGLNNLKPSEVKPILTKDVPFKPGSEGGGVDLQSPLVGQSQKEIARILPFLPYENNLTTASGKTISILIPSAQYQNTPWVLDVQIFGVNYQVNETDTDYTLQRELFLAAASNVFVWMKASGIDPEKVIISWGDKSYVRESADKWLSE